MNTCLRYFITCYIWSSRFEIAGCTKRLNGTLKQTRIISLSYIYSKMSPANCRPSFPALNVLMQWDFTFSHDKPWIPGDGNCFLRLLFSNEDRHCTNLRVQEKLTNMMPQCNYLAFAWRHRSTVVTSHLLSQKRPSSVTMSIWNERSMIVFRGFVCSGHKI